MGSWSIWAGAMHRSRSAAIGWSRRKRPRRCAATARWRRRWWWPGAGATVTAAALRTHLLARLPDYLVPAAYVVLDTLPLTPQGKVATRALPAPEAPAVAAAPRAPRTPTEDLLAGLWGQVLGLPEVGPDDHFFHLRRHSLLPTPGIV